MDKWKQLSEKTLKIDYEKEINFIADGMRNALMQTFRRRGYVVAISGGIDSSVCVALAVKAVGPKKVFGLLLPETDSSSDSTKRGRMIAEHLGIEYQINDIAPTLKSIGCYQWRDDAIREIFPEYRENWKNKITISGGMEGQINHFKLVVQSPSGELKEQNLGLKQYLQIVAATNFKQRIRKTMEYFHADRLNYAVVGTPNRLEYDQGFFVKNGDGTADIKPIAHLFKTQVYQIAQTLKLPDEICAAQPTTDTYSLAQGQDEFYFALAYPQMDLALWSYDGGKSEKELAKLLSISEEQASFIYKDIEKKRMATKYLTSTVILK